MSIQDFAKEGTYSQHPVDLGATKDNVLNSDNRLDDSNSDIDSSSFKSYAARRYNGYLSGDRVFRVIL